MQPEYARISKLFVVSPIDSAIKTPKPAPSRNGLFLWEKFMKHEDFGVSDGWHGQVN